MTQQDLKPSVSQFQHHLRLAAALLALTVLVFIQCSRFDFINLDDPAYVLENPRVLRGLSWENVRWAFSTFKLANWHPLTWLSHMLDVELFDENPGGHHLVNVVLHSVNTVLIYLVLASLSGRRWESALVAALFAVHPLRMESVAWVSERKDVLCALFFLSAVGCYGQYVRSSDAGRTARAGAWYAGLAFAFALGAMAKPMIVTLPCVLLLIDSWPLKRSARWGWLVAEKLPLLVMAGVSSVVTYIAQRGAMPTAQRCPLPLRLGNAVWAYGRYLKKTLWPDDLAAFYPYLGLVPGTAMPWWKVGASAALLVAVTLLVLWLWRRRGQRPPLVGWLWFLGMLVPTIGLVQVGMQSMADRYSYLPHVGLLIAIVWGAADLVGPRPAARRALAGVAIVIVAVLAITTAYQLRYWQNSYVLFQRALHLTGPNPMAANCVALWLTTHDRKAEALPYYLAALRMDPNIAGTHNNLGNLLRERGQLKSALAHLARAVSLEPNNAEAHHNLGNTLADLGRTDEAVAEFREALRLDPDLTPAYYNLGVTLAAAGRYDDAIDSFERALRPRPDDPDTRFVYALALAKAGRLDDAKRQFNLVLRTRSDWTEGMGHFAWLLATSAEEKSRDPQTAVALAEHANKLTLGDQPALLDTLGAAYASAGRFEEAVAVASRARDLASARGQRDFAGRIDERIQLYRSRRTFVASTQPVTAPATAPAVGR